MTGAQTEFERDWFEDALRKIAFDENTVYLACSDIPICTGNPHNPECAVGIARQALQEGKRAR